MEAGATRSGPTMGLSMHRIGTAALGDLLVTGRSSAGCTTRNALRGALRARQVPKRSATRGSLSASSGLPEVL